MTKILPVIDTHCDIVIPFEELKDNFDKTTEDSQTSLPLLKEANVKIIFAGFSYDDLLKNSYAQLKDIKKMVKDYPKDFELIANFSKVEEILESKKIGVILHIEGAAILDGDINKLQELYDLGVRSLGFTHNTSNSLGTGALVDNKSGLTKFGKEVIKKCNELNIILDLAHINEKGFYDITKLSETVPFVSHGNCRAITDNPRNYTDDQLKELAKLNSYIGIFFSGKFTKRDSNQGSVSIDDAIAHIKHVVEVVGIDYVGIGSDFGGITTGLPKGLEDHSKLRNLFELLKNEGFSDEDLEKLAYKNALNFIRKYQNK